MGTFSAYLATLAPTVTFWDSGELIAASERFGITHQPGYPLFCLTARLFSFIPLGSVAYRVNLQSAVLAALCVYVVYRACLIVFEGPDGARGREEGAGCTGLLARAASSSAVAVPALAAAMLAFVKVFWSQAVVAEVYAANALAVSTLFLLYATAARGRLAPARYMALSGFVFGLGVVNHMSLALFLPALALSWYMAPGVDGGRARLRLAAVAAVFVLLGLSVYLYLPVRGLADGAFDIGRPVDWRGFLWVVKWGAQAKSAMAAISSGQGGLGRIDLLDPRVAAAAAAAALVSWWLIRRDGRLFMPLILYFFLYLLAVPAMVMGSERDIRFGLPGKFFIPAYIMMVLFITAVSADVVSSRRGRLLALPLSAALAAVVLFLGVRNHFPNDRSKDYIAYDYAANSLKSAGEDGVLFTWGDNGAFPLWYLQQVECFRDDVALVHTPVMTYDWYLARLNRDNGWGVAFMDPFYLGENVFRIYGRAKDEASVAFDYSSARFLKLEKAKMRQRGLVYFMGMVPPGDPWEMYVFRGAGDPAVFKGGIERNILDIYRAMKREAGPA